MPVEIRELIVRAVVSNEELSASVSGAAAGDSHHEKMIAEALESHCPVHTLHAGGGFSRNDLWVQMLADIFQKTVVLPNEKLDASLLGALRFAGQSLGLSPITESQSNTVVEPNINNARVYQEAYQKFKTLVLTMH